MTEYWDLNSEFVATVIYVVATILWEKGGQGNLLLSTLMCCGVLNEIIKL